MRTLLVAILIIMLSALSPTWADCTCSTAEKRHGWCDACGVGYVGSVKIHSKLLHEELDAHGHDIDAERIRCAACRDAIAEDGFCERHKRGFVRGDAFLSPLAYYLARATHVEPSAVSCPVCRDNSGAHGWCDDCGRGMLGHFALDERDLYEKASVEYEVLVEANKKAASCETCAVAMVLDGVCPECRLAYHDGKPEPLRQDNR